MPLRTTHPIPIGIRVRKARVLSVPMIKQEQSQWCWVDVIAGQLAESLAQVIGASIHDSVRVELAETFSVWMLGLDRLSHGSDDLATLASETGRWHHQIRIDYRTEAFARSRPTGKGDSNWRITEVFQSDLARKIDASVTWIDEKLEGDPLVRLLTIPAYHLTAFWLSAEAGNQVLIVDAPAYYSDLQSDHQVLTQQAFFDKLRSLSHIEGRNEPIRPASVSA